MVHRPLVAGRSGCRSNLTRSLSVPGRPDRPCAALSAAGMKVAIIERKLFGGTCVNTGCIPTKTMVASAYAAHMARRAAEFGVVSSGAPWT